MKLYNTTCTRFKDVRYDLRMENVTRNFQSGVRILMLNGSGDQDGAKWAA
jgi:hypothetical protein